MEKIEAFKLQMVAWNEDALCTSQINYLDLR